MVDVKCGTPRLGWLPSVLITLTSLSEAKNLFFKESLLFLLPLLLPISRRLDRVKYTVMDICLCKVWVRKIAHIQILAISKTSTIFVRSSWNFSKMIASGGNHFYQVSWGLDQNCGFFTDGQFLSVSSFFLLKTYLINMQIFPNVSSYFLIGSKNNTQ